MLVIIGRCTRERVTVQHVRVAHATRFHSVAHVARLFPHLAEMKIGLIRQICYGYTGIMQECECTARRTVY